MASPSRGEIWLAGLDPTTGREPKGKRPCLVISADGLNQSRAELAIVIPITSKAKGFPSHVIVDPPEGGLNVGGFIKCEDIRSISTGRLLQRWGSVSVDTLAEVREKLRLLLNI